MPMQGKRANSTHLFVVGQQCYTMNMLNKLKREKHTAFIKKIYFTSTRLTTLYYNLRPEPLVYFPVVMCNGTGG